jgi:hypothetical protein
MPGYFSVPQGIPSRSILNENRLIEELLAAAGENWACPRLVDTGSGGLCRQIDLILVLSRADHA